MNEDLNNIKLSLLQLQRSVLIDTQTILQVLLSKGICNLEDLAHIRTKIETENMQVLEINKAIESLGGSLPEVVNTPIQSNSVTNEQLQELQELQDLLEQLAKAHSSANLE